MMKRLTADYHGTSSADLTAANIEQLKVLFPETFTDGKIDFAVLRQLLGSVVDEREERYGLNWPGKRCARQMALTPSTGTLRPCPDDSVGWDTTQNLVIEGDNLEVLKLLQRSYAGRAKLIYIDPPYNTGKDFVYPDDYRDSIKTYLALTGQAEGGRKTSSNPEASGRFHTDWLSMMYPRLKLARTLLSPEGFIFVSCDDNEVMNVRHLLDEIFGEEHFFAQIVVQSNKRGQTYKDIAKTHEYLVIYARGDNGVLFELGKGENALPFEDSQGRFDLWELRNRNPQFGRHNRPNLYYPIFVCPEKMDENGHARISLEQTPAFRIKVTPQNSEGKDGCWRWSKEKLRTLDSQSQPAVVVARQRRDGAWNIYEKSRKSTTKPKSIWDETGMINEQGTVELGALGLGGAFDHPKPIALIRKILAISTEAEDCVIDFFAGSGTTAHAVLAQNAADGCNRRFILVQLPEPLDPALPAQKAAAAYCDRLGKPRNIAELTKERLRRAAKQIREEHPTWRG
ncbi:MAG TPA: site-specific DNA-methyltransferase, partial [Symbiobacteriaceae bacterium]|nr:site-specific DNA-methyltransferase [Symbiobacteriaceae bacterium]